MATDQERIDAAITAYVRTYTEVELVQPADEGDTDPQLATIAMLLGVEIDAAQTGVLIDIGCGAGTLLKRMATKLLDTDGWQYSPIDFEEKLDDVSKLSRNLKLFSRTCPTTIAEFDADPLTFAGRKVYVCRNVLHELRISEAARLIWAACRDFGSDDAFLIQDLLKLPKSERHHHCWLAHLLRDALREIGFATITLDVQGWRSGNQWFNLRASKLAGQPTLEQVKAALLRIRQEQWEVWAKIVSPDDNFPKRPGPIDSIDLDLQFASLTRELRDEGLSVHLDPETQRRLRVNELVRRIEDIADGATPQGAAVEAHAHFRERGQQLTQIEDFLRSTSRLALVYGGPGTGKTTFIDQVLANRLYGKILVRIDLRSSRGVWPVLERVLSQLGVNLAAEVIGVLDDLAYDQVKAAIGRVLNKYATKMVFVFENVDEALNSNQRFSDPQLRDFLSQVIGKNGNKVILSSRRDYVPHDLIGATGNIAPVSVRMNRYGSDATVVNVLDDYFDRAGNGLETYPQSLITAIDRHPLVAALAGRILASEGKPVLRDAQFFHELKQKLRNELMERLLDDASRPAIEAASELRVPVPAALLERLVARESVHQARSSEILSTIPDQRWHELLQSLGLFKKRGVVDAIPTADELDQLDGVDHGAIADAYIDIYRADDDPTWIRESHYHRMLAGGVEQLKVGLGTYYRTELIASANYSFNRQRDYRTALDLFDAAEQIEPLDEAAAMWRASCLVRLGRQPEGDAEYARLVREYPSNVGIKRSHVDALLAIDEFQSARGRLVDYGLKEAEHDWHAQQWGRVELGLHHYDEAIKIFSRLRARKADDPYFITYLARALQQFGDLPSAIAVLEDGHATLPDNISIATSLAANLERSRQDVRAKEMLFSLFNANNGNVRALVHLIRILRRENDVKEAARLVRLAEEAKVARGMEPFLIQAHAELLLAQHRPEAAADYIREHVAGDESPGLLISALLEALDQADSPEKRAALLRRAAAVEIPERFKHNVPMQFSAASLAVRLGDRTAFEAAYRNLAETRIDQVELERLKQSFG